MLELQAISVAYGDHHIFTNLSATFSTGAVHGIVGSNGAGKTTLFKTLAHAIPLQNGSITLDGKPLTKRDYALLEIDPFFYPRITGSEYLRLFQFTNPDFDGAEWNRIFDLPLDDEINSYSAGMKKKLALLGIIGLKPRLMLLDEPLNSLDFDTSYILMDTLALLAKHGTTVLVSSHIVEPLLAVCQTITWLAGRDDIRHFEQNDFPALAQTLRPLAHDAQKALVERLLASSSGRQVDFHSKEGE